MSDIIIDIEEPIFINLDITPANFVQGPQGEKGDDGDQGLQGVQGIQGIQGIQGRLSLNTTLDFDIIDLSDLETGQTIGTNGFYVTNDGGGASYIILNGLLANGIDVFELLDGRFAKININNSINILQLGAKGDDITNNSTIFERAVDILVEGGELVFPKGIYRTVEPLIIKYSNITFTGYGATIKPLSTFNQKLYVSEFLKGIISISGSSAQNIYNIEIKGLKCDGTDFAGDPFLGQVAQNGIDSWYADRVRILNNEVTGIENYGIWFAYGNDCIIDGNTVVNAQEQFEVAQNVKNVTVSNNISIGGPITLNHYLSYANAENIKFISNTAKGMGNGITISDSNGGCSNILIENLFISSSNGHGIIIDGSSIYSNTDVRIVNNYIAAIANTSTAIKITGNEIFNDITIQGNHIYSPNNFGLYMDGAVGSKNLKICNNIIKSNFGNLINNISGLVFENNIVENIDVGALQYDNVAESIYRNNKFINSPITNTLKTIIDGNDFYGIGNNAINVGPNSIVTNNNGGSTNLVTGAGSILLDNRFQAYFGAGLGTSYSANNYKVTFPNFYLENSKLSINTLENTYSLNVKDNAEIESNNFGYGTPYLRLQFSGTDDFAHHGMFNNFAYFINNPYSGANDAGIFLATQGIRRFYIDKSGHIYFDSPTTITGATSSEANTNAASANVPLGATYKWDDGSAIHLMIRK